MLNNLGGFGKPHLGTIVKFQITFITYVPIRITILKPTLAGMIFEYNRLAKASSIMPA